MLAQDIAVLLKFSLQTEPRVLSKDLAGGLFLSPAEISNSLHRSKKAAWSVVMGRGVRRIG